jgi:hypothetical protein
MLSGSLAIQRTLAMVLLAAASHAWAAAGLSSGGAPPAAVQVQAFAAGDEPCGDTSVKQAVALIYQQGDMDGAAKLAARCEARAAAQGRALDKTIALRIQALIALRIQDMAALKQVGESLVADAPVPEYVADGHLFIAMACLFGGDPICARTHVDHAKAMFMRLHVADALSQIQPLENALITLEKQGE